MRLHPTNDRTMDGTFFFFFCVHVESICTFLLVSPWGSGFKSLLVYLSLCQYMQYVYMLTE